MRRARFTLNLTLLLLIAVCALAFALRLLPGARTIDDAFITFRYSRNLLDGLGFVYNPGIYTLGTTTPVWALILAGIGGLSRLLGGTGEDFPTYARVLSAFIDAVSCALIYRLARYIFTSVAQKQKVVIGGRPRGVAPTSGYMEQRARQAIAPTSNRNQVGQGDSGSDLPTTHPLPPTLYSLIPVLLFAISPMSVTFAVGGMETSLAIFWMLLAWGLGVGGWGLGKGDWPRGLLLGIVCGLAVWTRADSVLWIAPLLGWQFVEAMWWGRRSGEGWGQWARQAIAPTWVGVVVIVIPTALLAWVTFGSPLPNSVTAKRFAYFIEPGAAFVRLTQTYSTPFFEFDTFGSIGAMVGAIAYLFLSGLAIIYAARRLPRVLPIFLYPFLYMAVFGLLNPLIFRWYLAPPLPALILILTTGVWVALKPLLNRPDAARWVGRAAFTGVAGLWVFTSINGWVLHPDHGPDQPAPRMAYHEIELYYQRMGETLVREYGVTPQTRVASGDIGAIGYFSRVTIVDTVGLVTPELTRYYPVDRALIADGQNYAIPPQLIYDTQPQYLVTMEGFIRNGLARQPAFTQAYTLALEYPFEFYGRGMQLWQRQSTLPDGEPSG